MEYRKEPLTWNEYQSGCTAPMSNKQKYSSYEYYLNMREEYIKEHSNIGENEITICEYCNIPLLLIDSSLHNIYHQKKMTNQCDKCNKIMSEYKLKHEHLCL